MAGHATRHGPGLDGGPGVAGVLLHGLWHRLEIDTLLRRLAAVSPATAKTRVSAMER